MDWTGRYDIISLACTSVTGTTIGTPHSKVALLAILTVILRTR
jgi:hypothetical protein